MKKIIDLWDMAGMTFDEMKKISNSQLDEMKKIFNSQNVTLDDLEKVFTLNKWERSFYKKNPECIKFVYALVIVGKEEDLNCLKKKDELDWKEFDKKFFECLRKTKNKMKKEGVKFYNEQNEEEEFLQNVGKLKKLDVGTVSKDFNEKLFKKLEVIEKDMKNNPEKYKK